VVDKFPAEGDNVHHLNFSQGAMWISYPPVWWIDDFCYPPTLLTVENLSTTFVENRLPAILPKRIFFKKALRQKSVKAEEPLLHICQELSTISSDLSTFSSSLHEFIPCQSLLIIYWSLRACGKLIH